MTDNTFTRQELFNLDNYEPEVWAGHAFAPTMHDHVWLMIMTKAVFAPDHYRVFAYFDEDIPALVIALRGDRKVIDWTVKAFPDLTESVAKKIVAMTVEDYGFSFEDVLFCGKVRTVRPPTLVN